MWLRDTGILNKLKYDVMNPPMPIPPPKVRHNQPLILGQLGITMIIIAVGLFIAILVFLGEIWLNRKNVCTVLAFLVLSVVRALEYFVRV